LHVVDANGVLAERVREFGLGVLRRPFSSSSMLPMPSFQISVFQPGVGISSFSTRPKP
jgi:hypothetical protein